MKPKATHQGTCQCCGANQKLPNGVLSLHGYTVKWGFFSGTCSGSGELPYEQSCALIQKFVEAAEVHLGNLIAFYESLLVPAVEAKAWVHEYTRGKGWGAQGSYKWRYVDLFFAPSKHNPNYMKTSYTREDGKNDNVDYLKNDLLQDATELNKQRADALKPEIARVQQYIAWQNQRIAEWSLKDLKPIK